LNKIDKLFNFTNYQSNIALISDTRELTYQDIESEFLKIKDIIDNRCLVFLVCTNSIESIISYISILKSGSVCMLVSDIELENLIDKYQPKFIFCPKESNFKGKITKEIYDYKIIRTNYDSSYEINDQLAILLTTSGSTGSPKFVKISYDNLISNTNSIISYLNMDSSHRAITTMPMNYTYGLSIINTHLSKGASLVITDASLMNRNFWNLLKEKKVTNFGGVPYIYEILKKLRFEQMELPHLKYMTQAGGKLKEDLVLDFHINCKNKGIEFIVMYGQTEATSRMSYLPSQNLPLKVGSIGIAIPNGTFYLQDDKGNKIEECFKSGELIYKGQNVSMGYSESFLDLTHNDINNGLLYTGDLAHVDEEGFYFIVGRKNRFIKIFGNRVNLDEIENIIKKLGYECACTGIDDKINIYLVDKVEGSSLLHQIMEMTTLHKSAFNNININIIPRNNAGKILYYKLEEQKGKA
jgi:acyl-coenzyme A synthetase/AMP-(fatty) acid ligase